LIETALPTSVTKTEELYLIIHDYVTLPQDNNIISNNPLIHRTKLRKQSQIMIFKTNITANITGQNICCIQTVQFDNDKYPALSLTLENGSAASDSDYNYSQTQA
jgi:hypothetical protein